MLEVTEHFPVEICRVERKAAINRRWLSSLIMRAISPTMDSPHRSVALFLASFLLTATRPRYALVLALVAAVCPHVCTPPEPSEVPRSSHAGAVEAFVHEWSRVHSRLVRVHLGPDRLLATSRSLGRCAAVKKLHQQNGPGVQTGLISYRDMRLHTSAQACEKGHPRLRLHQSRGRTRSRQL